MSCRSAGSRRHHTTCEERPVVAIPATRGLAGSVLRRRRSRRGAGSEGGAAEARVSTRAAHVWATRAVTDGEFSPASKYMYWLKFIFALVINEIGTILCPLVQKKDIPYTHCNLVYPLDQLNLTAFVDFTLLAFYMLWINYMVSKKACHQYLIIL
jgi:hypothetical protein